MTYYYCRGSVRILFVLMLLVFGGAFVAFFLMPVLSAGEMAIGVRRFVDLFPLGLLFGGLAFAGLWGLLSIFTVFRMDASEIVKRRWNGAAHRVAWRDLIQVEVAQDGSGTLTDFRRNRMSIPASECGYRSKAGRSLYEALEEHLANLPEELKARLAEPREFRYGDNIPAIAAGFMVLLLLTAVVSILFAPKSGSPDFGLAAFFLFGALFMAHIGLQQATRILTLTDTSLIDRSVFGTREILYDQMVSVTTKDMQGKAGTTEITTVKSATTTIRVPSLLPNYEKLVEAIHTKVGAPNVHSSL